MNEDDFFRKISEASRKNKLVFFVGAGISREFNLPNWNDYLKELYCFWKTRIDNKIKTNDIIDKELSVQLKKLEEGFKRINEESFDGRKIVDEIYTTISKIWGDEWLSDHRIDYEKERFHISEKDITTQSVLFQLCKFDAAYITTNYDDSIEQYLEKVKGATVNFKDIYDFNDANEKFTINTVIHMHGSIKGNPDHIVSSLESYNLLYGKNGMALKGLKNILNDPETLIVFMGSSIEKDILNLMTNNEFDGIDKIRLVTSNTEDNYELDRKVVPFKYAESHDKLRSFLYNLSNKLYSNYSISNDENYYFFKESDTSDKVIFKILDQVENPFYLFTNLEAEIESKRIFQLISSPDFTSGKLFVCGNLWDLIGKYTNRFSNIHKNNIVEHISKSDKSYFNYRAYLCFCKMNPLESQKNTLYENLSQKWNVYISPFYDNDDLMASWFLFKKIITSNYYFEISDLFDSKRNYVLNEYLENKILTEIRKDKKLRSDFSFEFFCIYKWGILYKLVLENRIYLYSKLWINEIKNNHLSINPLKKINEFYDHRIPFYTTDVNIYEIEIPSINYADLINCNNLKKLFITDKFNLYHGIRYVNSVTENIHVVMRFLSHEKLLKNCFISFFICNINRLFENYKLVYYSLIKRDDISNELKMDLCSGIIKYYKNKLNVFYYDSIDNEIWEQLIYNCGSNNLLPVFANLNIDFSSDIPVNKFNDFITTSFYSYLYKLILCFHVNDKYLFSIIINSNSNLKDIAIGYFLPNMDFNFTDKHYYLLGILNSEEKSVDSKLSQMIDVSKLYQFDMNDIKLVIPYLLDNVNPLECYDICLGNAIKYIELIMQESKDYKYKKQWIEFLVKTFFSCTTYFIESVFFSNNIRYINFKTYRNILFYSLNVDKQTVPMLYLDEKLKKLNEHDLDLLTEIYAHLLKTKVLNNSSSYSFDYFINNLNDKVNSYEKIIEAANGYLSETKLQEYKAKFVEVFNNKKGL
ncbi:hypothetical protein AKUA1404_04810 [Apilactobacillus kunkeei]|nr:hypothetical protein AKUA1404_04810 [Apilactobacillus kunkeei]